MNNDELLILLIGENRNIGAETFAREALNLDHDAAIKGLNRLLEWDVPAEYIYAFWNDCCHRDTKLAIEVMNTYSKLKFDEAMDFYSHDRSKLKDLKKSENMQQQIDKSVE